MTIEEPDTIDRNADSAHIDEWVSLSGELVDGVCLRSSILVHIFFEKPEFVTVYDEIPISAFGLSRSDALDALRKEIVDHLDWLNSAGDKLSPRLRRERGIIACL